MQRSKKNTKNKGTLIGIILGILGFVVLAYYLQKRSEND